MSERDKAFPGETFAVVRAGADQDDVGIVPVSELERDKRLLRGEALQDVLKIG